MEEMLLEDVEEDGDQGTVCMACGAWNLLRHGFCDECSAAVAAVGA